MIEKSFPQDIIFLAGLLIICKVTLTTILSVYSAFKTFCAPFIWPIDYKDKYGPWAGIVLMIFQESLALERRVI